MIKVVPINLEFTKVEHGYWKSQYTLDKQPFTIKLMHYGYLLEVPVRFLVQFDNTADREPSKYIKTNSYEDAHRIAQYTYKGKGKAIQGQIIFLPG